MITLRWDHISIRMLVISCPCWSFMPPTISNINNNAADASQLLYDPIISPLPVALPMPPAVPTSSPVSPPVSLPGHLTTTTNAPFPGFLASATMCTSHLPHPTFSPPFPYTIAPSLSQPFQSTPPFTRHTSLPPTNIPPCSLPSLCYST